MNMLVDILGVVSKHNVWKPMNLPHLGGVSSPMTPNGRIESRRSIPLLRRASAAWQRSGTPDRLENPLGKISGFIANLAGWSIYGLKYIHLYIIHIWFYIDIYIYICFVFFEKWEWDDILNIPIIYPNGKKILYIDMVKCQKIRKKNKWWIFAVIITIEWLYLWKFNNKDLGGSDPSVGQKKVFWVTQIRTPGVLGVFEIPWSTERDSDKNLYKWPKING